MKLKYTYYFGNKAEDYDVYIIKEDNIYEVWIGKEKEGFRWFCFGLEELDAQMLANLDCYCAIHREITEIINGYTD